MGVRKIKKSYISCTGYFYSHKNNTQIPFESTLERDFYLSLEFNNQVAKYEEQPMSIKYEYLDKRRKYTPDTLVTYINEEQVLFEVKYHEVLKDDEFISKFHFLKKYIKEKYNLNFKIFTEKELPQIYLNNMRFLYKFAFIKTKNNIDNQIEDILLSQDNLNILSLLNIISDNHTKQLKILPYIWNYIFRNTKLINMEHKINMNSILSNKAVHNG